MRPEREITRYFKEIDTKNGKSIVYDMKAIENEGFPVNILISERNEKGKTYGIKELTFEHLKESGKEKRAQCLWLRSLADDVANEARKWFDDMPDNIANEVEKFEMTGGAETPRIYHKDLGLTWQLSNVSSYRTTKGTRTAFKEVVWDEFNVSTRTFVKTLLENFSNILSSSDNSKDREKEGYNPMRMWLLGNNKGLNHPILINLGITFIDKEVIKIYDGEGNPYVLFICPIYDEKERKVIATAKKNDWLFKFTQDMGTADNIYFNDSDVDDLNNIYRFFECVGDELKREKTRQEVAGKLHLQGTIIYKGQHLNIYEVPKERRLNNATFHILHMEGYQRFLKRKGIDIELEKYYSRDEKGNLLFHASLKEDLDVNVIKLDTKTIDKWLVMLALNKFSYENGTSKDFFLRAIRK